MITEIIECLKFPSNNYLYLYMDIPKIIEIFIELMDKNNFNILHVHFNDKNIGIIKTMQTFKQMILAFINLSLIIGDQQKNNIYKRKDYKLPILLFKHKFGIYLLSICNNTEFLYMPVYPIMAFQSFQKNHFGNYKALKCRSSFCLSIKLF